MRLKFTKMQGAGNDFVVLDASREKISLSPAQARFLADRHFGVGCDQILIVEQARAPGNDFHYRIVNADGGEVEACGNGARCFARFVRERGLTAKSAIRVETAAGIIVPRIGADGRVTVDMGAPEFDPAKVPFQAGERAPTYALRLDRYMREVSVLAMGNPHAVQCVSDVETAPVAVEGPLIERHPRFPQRVNAGFMQVTGRHSIRLRVWERGAGETLACGTGAAAAAVAGITLGLLDSPVEVSARGGELEIAWTGEGGRVELTGPAQTVFEGEIVLPD